MDDEAIIDIMLVLLLRVYEVFFIKKEDHKNFKEILIGGRKSLGNTDLSDSLLEYYFLLYKLIVNK